MAARTYSNPVYDRYFADPFVWHDGNQYYAVGTGAAEAEGKPSSGSGPQIFPLLGSRDLVSWESLGHALVQPKGAIGDSYWAPEVASHQGRWYLYYSVGVADTKHHLRVAVSDRARGPYVDTGVALTDLERCAFAIDPHPFRDKDGRWYLFHARDFLDETNGERGRARVGTALVVHELLSMTELAPAGVTVLRARSDWQRFQRERPMYGGVYDWHTLEGPCVALHDGRYYCFYSGGSWQGETYGVDYGVAEHVLGPYSDAGSEEGPRVLRTVPGRVLGPGHNSLVLGPDHKTPYFVYHAWDVALSARRLCIDRLDWTRAGPRAAGPTWTPQLIRVHDSLAPRAR